MVGSRPRTVAAATWGAQLPHTVGWRPRTVAVADLGRPFTGYGRLAPQNGGAADPGHPCTGYGRSAPRNSKQKRVPDGSGTRWVIVVGRPWRPGALSPS